MHDDSSPTTDTINLGGLALPWRPALAIVVSTLLLTYDWYYDVLRTLFPAPTFGDRVRLKALDGLGFYLLIPLIIIVLVYRERPAEYGFTLGDWRAGLKWTLIICAAAAPILYLAGRSPGMVAYYERYNQPAGRVLLVAAIDLLSWEFFFRGFLLWALYRVAGPTAVVLQAVPFALAHLSKPPLETLSTIFGGTLFGWVAWRTRSFLYPYLIHLFVMGGAVFVALTVGG